MGKGQKPLQFLLRLTLKLHQSPLVKTSPSIFVFTWDLGMHHLVALLSLSLSPLCFLSFFLPDAIIDKYQTWSAVAILGLNSLQLILKSNSLKYLSLSLCTELMSVLLFHSYRSLLTCFKRKYFRAFPCSSRPVFDHQVLSC